MKQMLLLILLLSSCAASTVKNSETPQTLDVNAWTSVRLTDLTGSPLITQGNSSDGKLSFFKIENRDQMTYFQIDNEKQSMAVIAPFATSAATVIEMNSFARDVQMHAMYDQYINVWRCRYSRNWATVASRDLRDEGPLLLNIPDFNENRGSFKVLIAIDSTKFEVTGLSGVVDGESHGGEAYYTSNTGGPNHLFGAISSATMLNGYFGLYCMDAYVSILPAYKSSSDVYEARVLNSAREIELSKAADGFAKFRGTEPGRPELKLYPAQSFDQENLRQFDPKFNLDAIESLIQTAKSGNGVGL